MGKEIERKWICKFTEELKSILLNPIESYEIKDYYFNEYTRLRYIGGDYKITIKSLGNLIRDEYEFTINKDEIDFVPAPCLCKKRVIYPYKGNDFELNVFKDILMHTETGTVTNLILAELENPNDLIELPTFFNREVTNDSGFYGYNLFNRVKHDPDKNIICRFG